MFLCIATVRTGLKMVLSTILEEMNPFSTDIIQYSSYEQLIWFWFTRFIQPICLFKLKSKRTPLRIFLPLKGQCHKIFDPRFFTSNNPP
jgi:hypothetical protein